MKINKQKNKRSKYNSINSNERAQIIQYIEEYKYSTSHVSMITGYNASTIKAIYQVFKKEGRIQKKEKRDKILNITTQVLLVMVDDKNKNFLKLGEEIKEFQNVKEDDNLRDIKEQMMKQQLQNNKGQILSQLVNQKAIQNFTQELDTITQQKTLTNDFNLINLSTLPIQQEIYSHQFPKNGHEKKYINQIKNPNILINQNQLILNTLDEQHRLMRM